MPEPTIARIKAYSAADAPESSFKKFRMKVIASLQKLSSFIAPVWKV
jgi:hypothetical protein